jgi:hypothetical protein
MHRPKTYRRKSRKSRKGKRSTKRGGANPILNSDGGVVGPSKYLPLVAGKYQGTLPLVAGKYQGTL